MPTITKAQGGEDKYEGGGYGRGLAMAKGRKSAQEATEETKDSSHEMAAEHMAKIHEGAKGASKSAHVYSHASGEHHVHAHDHEKNTHEHTVHDTAKEAMSAANEHMTGEPGQDGGDGEENPLGSLGLANMDQENDQQES